MWRVTVDMRSMGRKISKHSVARIARYNMRVLNFMRMQVRNACVNLQRDNCWACSLTRYVGLLSVTSGFEL